MTEFPINLSSIAHSSIFLGNQRADKLKKTTSQTLETQSVNIWAFQQRYLDIGASNNSRQNISGGSKTIEKKEHSDH